MESVVEKFSNSGFALIPDLFTEIELQTLRSECNRLVAQYDPSKHPASVFTAGAEQTFEKYFLDSSDKIGYFLEQNAWDEKRECLSVEKNVCLNKIGHALHWHNSIFKQFTFDRRFEKLAKSLGLLDPAIVQSMVIFKNPFIGTEVLSHQDASYLFCSPEPKVVGFWIPLEDATEENGCLQFISGSHRSHPLASRWIRHYSSDGSFQIKHTNPNAKYVGEFVSQPAPRGSCVLIDGLVVHRSNPNRSSKPRPVYTFHLYDRASCEWDQLNWLQPSSNLPFPSLYRG